MKKYITPAVEVTAMHHESNVMLTSIQIGDSNVEVGGGEGHDDSNGVGQLTNGYGWDSADWGE